MAFYTRRKVDALQAVGPPLAICDNMVQLDTQSLESLSSRILIAFIKFGYCECESQGIKAKLGISSMIRHIVTCDSIGNLLASSANV